MTIRDSPHTTHSPIGVLGESGESLFCMHQPRVHAGDSHYAGLDTHLAQSVAGNWEEKSPGDLFSDDRTTRQKDRTAARLIWSTSKWATKWPTACALYCQSQGQRLSLFLYTHNTRAPLIFLLFNSFPAADGGWRSTASTFIVCQCFRFGSYFSLPATVLFVWFHKLRAQSTKLLHLPQSKHCSIFWWLQKKSVYLLVVERRQFHTLIFMTVNANNLQNLSKKDCS